MMDDDEKPKNLLQKARSIVSSNLNFYRVHLLVFTFVPLIMSGIMYAANTQYHISYIDCLFLCYSSFCVTGLAPVNLSTLSWFQQFLIFVQTMTGSMVFVSLVMIYVRMYFFREKFKHIIAMQEKEKPGFSIQRTITAAPAAIRNKLSRNNAPQQETTVGTTMRPEVPPHKKKHSGPINKDMIKRVDGGGVGMINPMGWYDDQPTPNISPGASSPATNRSLSPDVSDGKHPGDVPNGIEKRNSSDSKHQSSQGSAEADLRTSPALLGGFEALHRVHTTGSHHGPANGHASHSTGVAPPSTEAATRRPYATTPAGEDAFPRSKTIAFDEPDNNDGFEHAFHPSQAPILRAPTIMSDGFGGIQRTTTMASSNFPRTYSMRPQTSRRPDPKYTGYGGFPTPFRLIADGFNRLFPRASEKIHTTVTMPRTNTISGRDSIISGNADEEGRFVPYISFSAVVGRNSNFKGLTEEQMDELGGVEYRALKLLFWIVLAYWIILPVCGGTIIAPYIAAQNRYDDVFNSQPRHVRIPWFAFFQSVSGFANLGMSLVDMSVVPFQRAYLMNAVVALLILFGNTCYPILLRFILWCSYQWIPKTSATSETIKFVLDHPRRCFVYLFPSTTTWFLVIVVLILTSIDFFTFMVLDIGTAAIEEISIGTRIAAGLFQSVAVRAAGFAIVPMNSLAPAVKVMFVIMMYISVYPIAMSVRSTNVYEERALGLFDEDEDDEDEDEEEELGKSVGAQAVAKYLGFHARRQLAFDMWWIVGALFLVCIIERPNLNDKEKWEYMNVFNIIFELVSAYGTVGLSLGVSYDNFSLVGAMRKLSKLVVCMVILRGRHRGLPVAIDRAVMLPREMTQTDAAQMEDRLRRMRSRMSMSQGSISGFPRTLTGATNRTFNTIDPLDRASDAGSGFLPNTATHRPPSVKATYPAAPPAQDTRGPSESPKSATRDVSPGVGVQRRAGHRRTMSQGSADSRSMPPNTILALGRTPTNTSTPLPPTSNKVSAGALGLEPLEESEMSRRPTLTEPEQHQEAASAATGTTALSEKTHHE